MTPLTPPIRLLAIDIDGTLLNSKFQVSDGNLSAIRRAHELGVEVLLTTGRRHGFALPVAEKLGIPLWVVSSNGAITRAITGELFHRDLMPQNVARSLLEHMQAFRRQAVLTFDLETRGAIVIESAHSLNASVSRWLEVNAPYIRYMEPLEACLTDDPVQAMFCGPVAEMNRAEECLAAFDRRDEITVLKTQYEARDLSILDVLNQHCSKGHALRRWAGHRGISRQQVMAIGDNYNDVEMLEFAGFPFIMENACAELKQNGWPVTASNDADGIAVALKQVGI